MERADQRLEGGLPALAGWQDKLYVRTGDTYAMPIALQAPDAAGGDGTVRHAMSGADPPGVMS